MFVPQWVTVLMQQEVFLLTCVSSQASGWLLPRSPAGEPQRNRIDFIPAEIPSPGSRLPTPPST